jgi:fatty acid desaturase
MANVAANRAQSLADHSDAGFALDRVIGPDRLRALRERSDLMGLFLVLHAWIIILGAGALVVRWPNPFTFVLAVVIIGGRQLGLAILMHDAAHRLLFRHARVNDWVGTWCCGAPIAASLALYRPYHLQHHRHTQQPEDPDLILSAPFPITRASFRRKMLRDLLGQTALRLRLEQVRAAMRPSPKAVPPAASAPATTVLGVTGDSDRTQSMQTWHQRWAPWWRLIANERGFWISNSLMLAGATACGVAWAYFALWLLPLLTWYQVITRIRNIAEHAVVGDPDDPLRNTRTTRAGWLARMIVAPYWVNYHLEHHLVVATPCWKLPRLHRWLIEAGQCAQMELASGYGEVLRKATARESDSPGTGQGPVSRSFF